MHKTRNPTNTAAKMREDHQNCVVRSVLKALVRSRTPEGREKRSHGHGASAPFENHFIVRNARTHARLGNNQATNGLRVLVSPCHKLLKRLSADSHGQCTAVWVWNADYVDALMPVAWVLWQFAALLPAGHRRGQTCHGVNRTVTAMDPAYLNAWVVQDCAPEPHGTAGCHCQLHTHMRHGKNP